MTRLFVDDEPNSEPFERQAEIEGDFFDESASEGNAAGGVGVFSLRALMTVDEWGDESIVFPMPGEPAVLDLPGGGTVTVGSDLHFLLRCPAESLVSAGNDVLFTVFVDTDEGDEIAVPVVADGDSGITWPASPLSSGGGVVTDFGFDMDGDSVDLDVLFDTLGISESERGDFQATGTLTNAGSTNNIDASLDDSGGDYVLTVTDGSETMSVTLEGTEGLSMDEVLAQMNTGDVS
jgi:hypothetical protein